MPSNAAPASASSLEAAAMRHETQGEEQERAAVLEERKRIARELHDVIAHSVTLMTVQAGAARLLVTRTRGRRASPCSRSRTPAGTHLPSYDG